MPTVQESGQDFTLITSDVTPVATPITLAQIAADKPHCFASVKFFADAGGTTPATPGAGTVDIEVQTVNNADFEDPPGNVIDATAIETVDWGANTKCVRATPAGITVATHYQLVVSCNKT